VIPHAHIVAGLTFGDEGKGTSVDYLARLHGANLVVRYNGGPQCAHNVVLPDGRHHTFAQFGSAYFVVGVKTYLSRHMLVEPFALLNEAKTLQSVNGDNPFDRIIIDEDCLVITPFHWLMNRCRESLRGDNRHGSCGHGVGEARADLLSGKTSLFVRDLKNPAITETKLQLIRSEKIDAIRRYDIDPETLDNRSVEAIYNENVRALCHIYRDFRSRFEFGTTDRLKEMLTKSVSIFEGAQGVLLDERYGFAPYYTWTDTTFGNAHELLNDTGVESTRIGVLRTILTRHGAGPFPTESEQVRYDGDHNTTNEWQGRFRFGHMDMLMLKYAMRAAGPVDSLFLTHLDKIPGMMTRYCVSYQDMDAIPFGVSTNRLMNAEPKQYDYTKNITRTLEDHLGVRVGYTSSGPTYQEKTNLLPSMFQSAKPLL
jgi:adenylosuccinate synthase